jgi:hypothetical protein
MLIAVVICSCCALIRDCDAGSMSPPVIVASYSTTVSSPTKCAVSPHRSPASLLQAVLAAALAISLFMRQ